MITLPRTFGSLAGPIPTSSLDNNFGQLANVVVNTLTELRTLTKVAGMGAFVLGAAAPGDGGGGEYYYDATDTTSADNGGSIIVAADGGRWRQWVPGGGISGKLFGLKGDGSTDDQPKFQAFLTAIAAAGRPGILPAGTYQLTTQNQTFNCPRDDGTVYPPWVGAGDANIAAETLNTMQFALSAPNGIVLVGEEPGKVVLKGSWVAGTSPVALSQGGCFIFGSSNDSALTGSPGIVALKNITFQNWMIGFAANGLALYGCQMENVQFLTCGINGVAQDSDGNAKWSNYQSFYGYAGVIVGGWWLMRSRTSFETVYMPPYPATDVFRTGWCDNTIFDPVQYSAGANNATVISQLDTFFDTYFFKSANSVVTASGGRASNNSSPSFAGFATYRGICGRAVDIISRYGRQSQRNVVRNMTGSGSVRTPVHASKPFNLTVDTAYMENIGWAVSQVTPFADPYYGVAGTLGTAATGKTYAGLDIIDFTAGGTTPVVGQTVTGTGIPANTVIQSVHSTTRVRLSAVATSTNTGLTFTLVANAQPPASIAWSESGSSLNLYNLLTDQNPANMPPASGGSVVGGASDFTSSAWNPGLFIGTTYQAGFTVTDSFFAEVGNLVFFSFNMVNNAYTKSGAGDVTIQGLPIPVRANGIGMASMAYISVYTATPYLHAYVSAGSNILLFRDVNRAAPIGNADIAAGSVTAIIQMAGFYPK